MRTKIILINGPAGSGKDTLGEHLVKIFFNTKEDDPISPMVYDDFTLEKFADPIKKSLQTFFNLDRDEFKRYDTVLKDIPQERFMGKTWRELCIAFSEDFVKKTFDTQIFGKLLRDRIKDKVKKNNIVVTDSGFDAEALAINELYHGDLYLIQLSRPGKTFDGDSRNYLTEATKRIIGEERCFWLHNDTTEEEFLKNGSYLVIDILDDKIADVAAR